MVPVELASFQAHVAPHGVRLSWVTLSETDNLGFHVLRAAGHSNTYRQITDRLIKGSGTTTARTAYEHLDADVVAGNEYLYKLQQVDVGGATAYHGPVAVTVPPRTALRLDLAPNPSSGGLKVFLSVPTTSPVAVGVRDVAGRQVGSVLNDVIQSGCHAIAWQAPEGLAAGMYVVEARAGGLAATRRWVHLP
jgi:hypothetical protein